MSLHLRASQDSIYKRRNTVYHQALAATESSSGKPTVQQFPNKMGVCSHSWVFVFFFINHFFSCVLWKFEIMDFLDYSINLMFNPQTMLTQLFRQSSKYKIGIQSPRIGYSNYTEIPADRDTFTFSKLPDIQGTGC